jgi:tRNA-splicing ligase RtcB
MSNDYSKINTYRHNNINITTGAKFPIKEWTIGVDVEEEARKQLFNVANLPFIFKHIAVMPDCHSGIGATVGSVIPTTKAIIPAAVGVDLGCGVCGIQTTLKASHLPDDLHNLRSEIENAIPHGRTDNGGENDKGTWKATPPVVEIAWNEIKNEYEEIIKKHPKISTKTPPQNQLGTLGSGNHFQEICIDENQNVWILVHSGSRGIGNRIGTYFINLAKKEMEKWFVSDNLPDMDLAYLPEDSLYFSDYIQSVNWAQKFASINRNIMINSVIKTMKNCKGIPQFETKGELINNHHNYVTKEFHFGNNIWVTRKGAVRARIGDLSIIPGSMGAKSFVVSGLGNKDSFCSASHGAGRKMSRTKARNTFSIQEHTDAVKGIECRIDADVIDETPAAYKDIDAVMAAQSDLVTTIHTLKQVLCIKG